MELTGSVLISVANPKQFLFAPFELAIVNMTMAVLFMVLGILIFEMTPFFSLIPLIGGHVLLIGMGSRDQHITTIIQATSKYAGTKRNLMPTPKKIGHKYVP